MLVSWSKVTMHSQGVFDVWFACPHCGFESWARAYGVGSGFDTGVQKTASAANALVQANVMAEHAAMRAVHGSPCPRCAKHHPEVVKWAENAIRERKRREATRATARVLVWTSVVVGIGATVLGLIGAIDRIEAIALLFVGAAPYGIARVMLAMMGPVHVEWILYPKTAPGVTFQITS